MLLRVSSVVWHTIINPIVRNPKFLTIGFRQKSFDSSSKSSWGTKKQRESLLAIARTTIMASPEMELVLAPLRAAVKEQVNLHQPEVPIAFFNSYLCVTFREIMFDLSKKTMDLIMILLEQLLN